MTIHWHIKAFFDDCTAGELYSKLNESITNIIDFNRSRMRNYPREAIWYDFNYRWTSKELGQNGHIIVPATLGSSVARVIWDTGAGLTTVDQKFIADHPENFRFIKNIKVGDAVIDGASTMKLYMATELIIGNLHLKDIRILSADFSAIQEKLNDNSIFGAAGFNVLESYNWYFDMKSKTYSVR